MFGGEAKFKFLLGAATLAALLGLAPGGVVAREIKAVRLGLHRDHTRLVVDLDRTFAFRITPRPSGLEILFPGTELAGNLNLPRSGRGRIGRLAAGKRPEGAMVEVFLTSPSRSRAYVLSEGPKLVVELRPARPEERVGSQTQTPPKPRPKTEPPAKTRPQPQPSGLLGHLLSGETVKLPLESTDRTRTAGPAGPVFKKTVSAAPPVQAGPFQTTRPVPPPPAGPPAGPGGIRIVGPEKPAPGKPAQAVAEARALAAQVRGSAQEAPLTAEEWFKRGEESFIGGQYGPARTAFERAEALAPRTPLGLKALYARAKAMYRSFDLIGQPSFDQVETACQKALGAWPDSPQASQAMLQQAMVNYKVGNVPKAQAYFNLLIQQLPKSPEAVEAQFYLAKSLLGQGATAAALRILRQVVAEHPDHPLTKEGRWLLGRALFETGRYLEAFQHLNDLDRRWPDFRLTDPMLCYYLGEASFRLNRMADARNYLYWILNVYPQIQTKDLLLARIGDTYLNDKDFSRAIVVYTETEARYPDSDGALIAKLRLAEVPLPNRAEVQRMARVFDVDFSPDAVQTYRFIAEKYPDRPVAQLALLKLGAYFYQNKEYNKSYETLSDLLARYPQTEFMRDSVLVQRQALDKLIRQYDGQDQPLKLIEFYQAQAGRLPKALKLAYLPLVAKAFQRLNLHAKAAETYQEALDAGEKDPAILLGLGLSHYQLADYARAAEALGRFVAQSQDPAKDSQAWLRYGQSLLKTGRAKEAAGVLARLADVSSSGLDLLALTESLSEALTRSGQAAQAQARLEKALAGPLPDEAARRRLLSQLAESLTRQGQAGRAVEALAQATAGLEVKADQLGLYYRLALAYEKSGAADKARAVLEQVVQSGDPFWQKLAADRLALQKVWARAAESGKETKSD